MPHCNKERVYNIMTEVKFKEGQNGENLKLFGYQVSFTHYRDWNKVMSVETGIVKAKSEEDALNILGENVCNDYSFDVNVWEIEDAVQVWGPRVWRYRFV